MVSKEDTEDIIKTATDLYNYGISYVKDWIDNNLDAEGYINKEEKNLYE